MGGEDSINSREVTETESRGRVALPKSKALTRNFKDSNWPGSHRHLPQGLPFQFLLPEVPMV